MTLVAFFGLLFCLAFRAQQKSEEKWRMNSRNWRGSKCRSG
jgi:hypothetical protein